MSGHAFCIVNECVEAAQDKSLTLLAITDHGPSMENPAHEGYFEMSTRLPKRFGTLGVLFGCEANVLNREGDIDLSSKTLLHFFSGPGRPL
jgi:putative hydrolase